MTPVPLNHRRSAGHCHCCQMYNELPVQDVFLRSARSRTLQAHLERFPWRRPQFPELSRGVKF